MGIFELTLTCKCAQIVAGSCTSFACKGSGVVFLMKGGSAAVGGIAAIEAVNTTAKIFPNVEYLRRLSWSGQWLKRLPSEIVKVTYDTLKNKEYNYYFYVYPKGGAFVQPFQIASKGPVLPLPILVSISLLGVIGILTFIRRNQNISLVNSPNLEN